MQEHNIPHDQIAIRAFQIWKKNGCPEWTHFKDWFQAIKELKKEQNHLTQNHPVGSLGTCQAVDSGIPGGFNRRSCVP